MQALQRLKIVPVTSPAAVVDNASFTTATIDTKGWDEALFVFQFGAMDIAMAALKLQESDDSGMSGATDISGADFSVSGTLPSDSADDTLVAVHVKLGGSRKRYIDAVATGGNGSVGTYMSAFAVLGKGEVDPSTAAGRGFGQLLTV